MLFLKTFRYTMHLAFLDALSTFWVLAPCRKMDIRDTFLSLQCWDGSVLALCSPTADNSILGILFALWFLSCIPKSNFPQLNFSLNSKGHSTVTVLLSLIVLKEKPGLIWKTNCFVIFRLTSVSLQLPWLPEGLQT